ncbi:ImmA/IrrE family metallo-endopeptidase [Dactylosporangium roseum]|uniref:ImmA/IrrE family metallo-endopeptidase n=1 Tax=Dactylosporangium roseum TaxID=47989 RepID=A0ABY5Z4R1_9ACTN|nr:XRE family transcriptional regulator [Dactylosporangium roseum]UWZ37043.1 ImmA/IrrE family metallo-endopeptidase [Dactylosporangium roseum]
MTDAEHLHLAFTHDAADNRQLPTAASVARVFDPSRLTQARHLAGRTKRQVAEAIGVTPAAVGQYEAGTKPRAELVEPLAAFLNVPVQFFAAGRPHAKLDTSAAHFRHLRSSKAYQRAKAVAFVEQLWELTHALEQWVRLPQVDVPGFAGGEVEPGVELPAAPADAARALRQHWQLGTGPIPHLVRTLEMRGIIIALAPLADGDAATVDAFSTSRLPRPTMVVTRDRADDVYWHRFTVAHELGHLVLHGDTIPGDTAQEREADAFAAEFLTPQASILPDLPGRLNFTILAELQSIWGVSINSLLYRCREVGLFSDSTAARAYQRLRQLRNDGAFAPQPIAGFTGEQPTLLARAFAVAAEQGLTMPTLAEQLAWPLPRVRELLGTSDHRPMLRLV